MYKFKRYGVADMVDSEVNRKRQTAKVIGNKNWVDEVDGDLIQNWIKFFD